MRLAYMLYAGTVSRNLPSTVIPMTLLELLNDRYAPLHNLSEKTRVLYVYSIERLQDFIAETEGTRRPAVLEDLNDLTVSRFLRWRAQTPRKGRLPSQGSVLKDRVQIAAMATYAARKRLIPEFLELPRMRPVERIPRGYRHADVERIIRAARHRRGHIGPVPAAWLWMTVCWTAWLTGERLTALLSLRWEDVDLERRTVTFRAEARKGHTRDIQRGITQPLAQLLAMHRRGPRELVWPWMEHRAKRSIFTSLEMLTKAAGVQFRGFHGFRKSSASYLKAAGGDATEHLDHDRPSTTKRSYLDPDIVTGGPSAADLLPPLNLDEPGSDKPAA